jgi:DNA-binding NtrC family response regulator
VAAGRFREDLLYRLNTIEIQLPPLRERREDIVPLAVHFLVRYATRYRKPVEGFEPAALDALRQASWPGNVRELDHAVERAVLLAERTLIRREELAPGAAGPSGPARLDELTLEEVEKVLIQKALARAGGNVSEAAKGLGLSRSALYRRLERYGL